MWYGGVLCARLCSCVACGILYICIRIFGDVGIICFIFIIRIPNINICIVLKFKSN